MIAIGNVKLGVRIEPIYLQELSKEEFDSIIGEHNISLNENVNYPIDTRIVNVFKSDRTKLQEYISICKYASERRNSKDIKRVNKEDISLFDDNVQINYELQDLRKADIIDKMEKLRIYNKARETQNIFKAFGAKNVNIHMSLLDKAYFEVQKFLQSAQLRNQTPKLAEAKGASRFREGLYNQQARENTDSISNNWKATEKTVEKSHDEELNKS